MLKFTESYKVLFPRVAGIRRAVVASLDLAYVASGRLDGFWEFNLKQWDIAAGILIVEEAGGNTNDISKFKHNSIDIRAASSAIYGKMMQKLVNF